MSNNKHGVSLIQLSNYVKPEIKEYPGRKWVLYGEQNWFFQYIIDRYNGSPTNEAIINTYCELIYGKGIAINGENFVYNGLNEIFNKREQKKCIADFKIFGQYAMQILRAKGGGVAKILHIPINKLGMERADENGDINNVFYCDDWTNPNKFKPEPYPIFKGDLTAPIMIKMVQPYRPGKVYWSDPNYLSGLQYAEMEEEISNYCINHIKSGLSFGYIINFNNGGALSPEQKDEIERMIREKLTGSSNAGKFILSFNDGKEAEVTVVPLEVNDAHNQWEFLTKESRQQLITAHGVFPNLFGINDGGGFANNADELNVQSKLLQDLQISPMQSMFIDELAGVLELTNLETDLEFIPLRETYSAEETVVEETVTDNTIDEEEVVEDNVELSLAGFDPNQKRQADGRWGSGGVSSDCSFENWFGNSKVVDKNGEPLEVYHGSTHDFTEFSNVRGNIENDMGIGFYFSSSLDDVEANYDDNLGADLKNRIERLAERLESDLDISYDEAEKKATKKLSGGKTKIIKAFISMNKPIIIGGKNDTFLDYNFDEENAEENGLLVDFFENYQWASSGFYDVDANKVFEGIEFYDGMYASDFVKAIKSNEALVYATDEYGNSASNEILRKTFELMGFDGIIDNTVSRFNMDGVYDDTKHIIAFQPNQIKSVNAKSWCKDNNNINLSNHIQKFISLGENISDDWQVIDERRCDEITLKENDLNTVFEFAQTPKTSKKKSKQDTSLFKIRYQYAGNPKGERDFCNKVIKANKVYREEDLNANYNYNEDFAPSGDDSYNIFYFKGGTNCKHWWKRVIYLKKNNKKISVNDARKMILKLEPGAERDAARYEKNDKKVAQIAEQDNNYWSLKPNYRNSGKFDIQKLANQLLKLAGFDPFQKRGKDGKWTKQDLIEFDKRFEGSLNGKPKWQNCLSRYAARPTMLNEPDRLGFGSNKDCVKYGLSQLKNFQGQSFRGIKVNDSVYSSIVKDAKNGVITFKNISSSSRKKSVAFKYADIFGKGKNRILFVLDGLTGKNIAPYVRIGQQNELEVLFDENTNWDVIKMDKDYDGIIEYTRIFLKEKE